MKYSNSSLNDLIQLYGEPSALIDNFQSKTKGYAIWGYKTKFRYDLKSLTINNKEVKGEPFQLLQDLFDTWVLNDSKIKSIGFIGYDIKNILYPHIKFKISHTKYPCLWFAQPNQIEEYELKSSKNNNSNLMSTFRFWKQKLNYSPNVLFMKAAIVKSLYKYEKYYLDK